jgi:hypothetical protein
MMRLEMFLQFISINWPDWQAAPIWIFGSVKIYIYKVQNGVKYECGISVQKFIIENEVSAIINHIHTVINHHQKSCPYFMHCHLKQIGNNILKIGIRKILSHVIIKYDTEQTLWPID